MELKKSVEYAARKYARILHLRDLLAGLCILCIFGLPVLVCIWRKLWPVLFLLPLFAGLARRLLLNEPSILSVCPDCGGRLGFQVQACRGWWTCSSCGVQVDTGSVSKENLPRAFSNLARWTGFMIFLRCGLVAVSFMGMIVFPISMSIWFQRLDVLLLMPLLLYVWWKLIKYEYRVRTPCPVCGSTISIQRKEDVTSISCEQCGLIADTGLRPDYTSGGG